MKRTELLDILQEKSDACKKSTKLRDSVIDAMEIAYMNGKIEVLNRMKTKNHE